MRDLWMIFRKGWEEDKVREEIEEGVIVDHNWEGEEIKPKIRYIEVNDLPMSWWLWIEMRKLYSLWKMKRLLRKLRRR